MQTSKSERAALAALSAIAPPANRQLMRRVAAIGPEKTWDELRGGSPTLDESGRLMRLARDVDGLSVLSSAANAGMRFVCPGDDEWPAQLDVMWSTLDTQDDVPPPFGLYIRGNGSLADITRQAVTVVGSRAASRYGERVAADLAADLAMLGWTVVSGGAYGIDAAGHRGCLAMDGLTVAVLACGVDIAYPRPHEQLLGRIAERGVVVSEVPPGTRPTKSLFLARNRIIAALATGTVVVEAALRSGAHNTAKWTSSLSRQVMAVPGPVTSSLSEGCHKLIRGDAALVTSAAEVIDLVGGLGIDALPLPSPPRRPLDGVSPTARDVFETLPSAPGAMAAEMLVARTGMQSNVVNSALNELANAGLVVECLDGWRIREGHAQMGS